MKRTNHLSIKTSALLLGLLLSSMLVASQPVAPSPQGAKEKIETLKVGFITKRLDLTPEEARSFWPVYNQFQREIETLRHTRRQKIKNTRADYEYMNDKEIEAVVDGEIVFKQNELDILKKYHAQLKQVLPIRKLALLYRAEEEFKRELLHRIGENKERMAAPGRK